MNSGDQPIRVMMKINAGIEREPIAKGESFEFSGKTLRFRHRRVVYQDRDNRDAILQGARHFEPNEIGRIVDPPVGRIAAASPFRSDDGHDDLGALQGCLDVFAEIDAVWNGIEIHEDRAFAELGLETIVKPARDWAGILPAIGNSDHGFRQILITDRAGFRQ